MLQRRAESLESYVDSEEEQERPENDRDDRRQQARERAEISQITPVVHHHDADDEIRDHEERITTGTSQYTCASHRSPS